MVTSIIIGVALVISVALIVFKGININFNKTFTINDNRKTLTREETEHLEQKLNAPENSRIEDKKTKDKEQTYKAPLDSVLTSMQELFGPEDPNGGNS